MLTYCVRRHVYLSRQSVHKTSLYSMAPLLRAYFSAGKGDNDTDLTSTLMQLCAERYFIAPGESHRTSFRHGRCCGYGPLGVDLKKNLLEQWWSSVMRSRAQVFGISTLHGARGIPATGKGSMKLVDSYAVEQILNQKALTKEQVLSTLQKLLQDSTLVRTNLLQGALEQYVPSLELVNRKLPFGLAEAGQCYQPSDEHTGGTACSSEVTESSLVWFCSPRTTSQWLDYWARQRLQWWRKFALGPSDFSCCDDAELQGRASRGVQVLYGFPWGAEPLETLWILGEAELLKTHQGVQEKLQCRDGRKSVVPHVISVSGNMDRGAMAYLFNSLQEVKNVDGKQRLHQRKVLKLHPTLAPVKVALDMGRGSTVELRQVCEGLLQEFLDEGISAWPGYLETMHSSLEQLHTKYDEMGVLFTVVVSESTLENGLLLVRSRDTTVRETMHISEVKHFLHRYISAAGNI